MIGGFEYEVVDNLPAVGEKNKRYFMRDEKGFLCEYIWIDDETNAPTLISKDDIKLHSNTDIYNFLCGDLSKPMAKIKYSSGISLIEEPIRPITHPTNCVNCGAVLKTNKCEYCGTEYL